MEIKGFKYVDEGLIKTTVAEAKDDAIDILTTIELPEGVSGLSKGVFIWAMEGRKVTVSAAQDTLRFLGGTGLLPETPDYLLDVATFRERYAAHQASRTKSATA